MKARPVLSVADAVTRLVADLGAMACARAVGKSSGLIYRWANPDDDCKPSLEQAIALDQLWLMSGRADAPLLAAYRAQLGVAAAAAEPQVDLSDRALAIGAECGELQGDVLAAARDGNLSPNEKTKLAKDLRDVRKHLDSLERALAEPKGSR